MCSTKERLTVERYFCDMFPFLSNAEFLVLLFSSMVNSPQNSSLLIGLDSSKYFTSTNVPISFSLFSQLKYIAYEQTI